jgi:hypothetical protein
VKARIYVHGQMIGETDLALITLPGCAPREAEISDPIAVAIVDEHPEPTQRPLFIHGRLETA